MSRQTRKSISIPGLTYQRFRKYCLSHDLKMGAVVKKLIEEKLDAEGWPEEHVLVPVKDLRFSQKVDKPLPKVEESKSEVIKPDPPKETPKNAEGPPDYISPIQTW